MSSSTNPGGLPFHLSEQQNNSKQQPPLNQQYGYNGQNPNNNHGNFLNNSTNSNNNLNNSSSNNTNHMRSKSPPSLNSPPMSPVSRMPNSPKSPRARNSLNNIVNNNYNNSTKLSNSVSTKPFPFFLFFFCNFILSKQINVFFFSHMILLILDYEFYLVFNLALEKKGYVECI